MTKSDRVRKLRAAAGRRSNCLRRAGHQEEIVAVSAGCRRRDRRSSRGSCAACKRSSPGTFLSGEPILGGMLPPYWVLEGECGGRHVGGSTRHISRPRGARVSSWKTAEYGAMVVRLGGGPGRAPFQHEPISMNGDRSASGWLRKACGGSFSVSCAIGCGCRSGRLRTASDAVSLPRFSLFWRGRVADIRTTLPHLANTLGTAPPRLPDALKPRRPSHGSHRTHTHVRSQPATRPTALRAWRPLDLLLRTLPAKIIESLYLPEVITLKLSRSLIRWRAIAWSILPTFPLQIHEAGGGHAWRDGPCVTICVVRHAHVDCLLV